MNMDDKCPLISLITTVYNTEKYVDRCFNSIMEQSYPNIELIVVNNASSGNITEIVKTYQDAYPDRKIKLLQFEENQGVFNARVKGAEIATGDYIAFIDSDDRVSIDYYRFMITKATETNSDIVIANVVYENPNGELFYQNYNSWTDREFSLEGKDIFDFYFHQEGLLFSVNLIWNKIFTRKLWSKACEYLRKNTKKIVMYDDMAIMSVLYFFANKLQKISYVQYYYFQNTTASSKGGNSYKKFKSIINDISNSFEFIENFLKEKNQIDLYCMNLQNWKSRYFRVWKSEINQSKLASSQKKSLIDELKKVLNCSSYTYLTEDDNYFYDLITSYSDDLEKQVNKILDPAIKCISFDIFDTLITRPFYQPTDLFKLLNQYINEQYPELYYVDFEQLRISAEHQARARAFSNIPAPEDIDIEAIYEELARMIPVSQQEIESIMNKEIDLEKRFCKTRKIGKYLYDIAVCKGKEIICISDMYLHSTDIKEILESCGYDRISSIYVSSEIKLTKNSGSLYKYVLANRKIPAKSMLHIGDNYHSDICVAQKYRLNTIHLINAKDNMIGANKLHYHGEFTSKAYLEKICGQYALTFSGIRFQLGLIADKLFDNPYEDFNFSSDLNGSPYRLGYYVLGSYLLSTFQWLNSNLSKKKYNHIHFIARDGWLFKQAYDILSENKRGLPLSNYLYISRRAAFPLAISSSDDLYTLHTFYNIHAFTPRKLISYLAPLFNNFEEDVVLSKLLSGAIIADKPFSSLGEWLNFMKFFDKNFYSQQAVDRYRAAMRTYFSAFISESDCTFDAGYSARSESILTRLLGTPIDAFYLYANEERCFTNSGKRAFNVNTLHPISASVPRMMILETMISDINGSCIGYNVSSHASISPIFEDSELNFQTRYIIQQMHKGALDFVHDWKNCFGDFLITLRANDLLIPIEYFMSYAKPFERHIFSAAYFDDPLFFEQTQRLSAVFDALQHENIQDYTANALYCNIPKWKKAAILALTDRKILKEKIKSKYSNHPIFLKILGIGYSIPRGIYHLFKR